MGNGAHDAVICLMLDFFFLHACFNFLILLSFKVAFISRNPNIELKLFTKIPTNEYDIEHTLCFLLTDASLI